MVKKPLSIWLWLWIPLAFIICQLGLELFAPKPMLTRIHSENGPHEFLQFIIMVLAVFVAGQALSYKSVRKSPGLGAWFILAFIGAFYVAGEEISWGQHIFEWSSPEFWKQINDQGETNLHNTSSWLDQKPRLLLEIGVMAGGTIIPLLNRYRQRMLPRQFDSIYPPLILVPVALIVLLLKVSDKALEALDIQFFSRVSEVIELTTYYYVLLYLLQLKKKVTSKLSRKK